MKAAQKSPAYAPSEPAASRPAQRSVAVNADSAPAPSGALIYQAMLDQRLREVHEARYSPRARLAIMLGGGAASWAVVLVAAHLIGGLLH